MEVIELPAEMEQRARALHREALVFDACFPTQGFFLDEEAEIQALVDGGVDGANVTVGNQLTDFVKVVDSINQHKRFVAKHSDRFRLCTTVAGLEQCKREGKIGLVLHFQDAKPIEDSLDYLRTLYELGLRVLQLTYNVQGWVGTGCCDRHDAGLSSFGLEVVEECNRLGILIDLSHCAYTTTSDALKHSRAPVSLTHVGAYPLCAAPRRNKPDDLVKAVVEAGGVVGVTFFPSLLKRNPATNEVVPSTVEDVLDHVDYMVKLVGVDSVGLGSDLTNLYARTLEVPPNSAIRWYRPDWPDVYGVGPSDRYDPYPAGIDSHSKMLNITRGLVKRGYKDEEIKGILGGNWLRLNREVWRG